MLLADAEDAGELMPALLATNELTWPQLCDWHRNRSWDPTSGCEGTAEPVTLSFRLRALNCCYFALAAAVQALLRAGTLKKAAEPSVLAANADTAAGMACDMLTSLTYSLESSMADAVSACCLLPGAAMAALGLIVSHELQPLAALLVIWTESLGQAVASDGVSETQQAVAKVAGQVEKTAASLQQALPEGVPQRVTEAGLSAVGDAGKQRLLLVGSEEIVTAKFVSAVEHHRAVLRQLSSALGTCVSTARQAVQRAPGAD